MPATPRPILAALTAVSCVAVLCGGVATVAFRAGGDRTVVLPEDFALVNDLLGRVQAEALEVPPTGELYDSALSGALEGLLVGLEDPNADYFDPGEYAELNAQLEGTVSGIGVIVGENDDGGLVIVNVLDGTPAAAAGLEAGEVVVSIDGRDVTSEPSEVIVELIKGEPGTAVVVGLDGGSQGPREVEIVREVIEVPNLEQELLDDGTGYILLRQFSGGTGDEVRAAADDLLAAGATGLVLDLRDNPGGLLNQAVDVASVFIEEGTIVTVESRDEAPQSLSASGDARADVPLVVLVNEWSASASEIVAGAIQDLDRGLVIGETSFGKGSVQTIRALSNGGGYKFTTAEYFTPSGGSIEGVGVVPDQTVDGAEAQLAAAQDALRALTARNPGVSARGLGPGVSTRGLGG